MPLTSIEKADVRRHLEYIGVSDQAHFALGIPAAQEPLFMLERAMDLLTPEGEQVIRATLGILAKIEAQMVDDLELLAVEQVDEIRTREKEQAMLERQYLKWRADLSNTLGVDPNPFGRKYGSKASGGINVSVQH
jgi:hypothetical protein